MISVEPNGSTLRLIGKKPYSGSCRRLLHELERHREIRINGALCNGDMVQSLLPALLKFGWQGP